MKNRIRKAIIPLVGAMLTVINYVSLYFESHSETPLSIVKNEEWANEYIILVCLSVLLVFSGIKPILTKFELISYLFFELLLLGGVFYHFTKGTELTSPFVVWIFIITIALLIENCINTVIIIRYRPVIILSVISGMLSASVIIMSVITHFYQITLVGLVLCAKAIADLYLSEELKNEEKTDSDNL